MTVRRKLDPKFIQDLLAKYKASSVWPYIDEVVPYLVFEVMSLGEEAVILGKITAKLKLDDGHTYKLRFDHKTHVLELRRMVGKSNGPLVATFCNGTTQQEVWLALHPKWSSVASAAQVAAGAMGQPASL